MSDQDVRSLERRVLSGDESALLPLRIIYCRMGPPKTEEVIEVDSTWEEVDASSRLLGRRRVKVIALLDSYRGKPGVKLKVLNAAALHEHQVEAIKTELARGGRSWLKAEGYKVKRTENMSREGLIRRFKKLAKGD